jgi:hypothetical protein
LLLLFLPLQPAQAILVGGGSFDELISDGGVIVKFHVTKVEKARFEMIGFSGKVLSVLKADGKPVASEQTFQAPAPVWPKDLGLGLGEGQKVILVLRRTPDGALCIENNMGAILPATKVQSANGSRGSPSRQVFIELKSVLAITADEIAKARILILLSQLASRDDLHIFVRLSTSPEPWVRRAALVAVARIKPEPAHILPLVEDFKAHLANPENEYVFWKLYDDVRWAARCGAFGMKEALASRARAYLPIYRTLVDKAPPGYDHVYVGIEGLKNVGTREDLRRLYEFHGHRKAWVRHDVLEGLGRILGKPVKRLEIISYEMPLPPEVAPWEEKTLSHLEKVLREQGILDK